MFFSLLLLRALRALRPSARWPSPATGLKNRDFDFLDVLARRGYTESLRPEQQAHSNELWFALVFVAVAVSLLSLVVCCLRFVCFVCCSLLFAFCFCRFLSVRVLVSLFVCFCLFVRFVSRTAAGHGGLTTGCEFGCQNLPPN